MNQNNKIKSTMFYFELCIFEKSKFGYVAFSKHLFYEYFYSPTTHYANHNLICWIMISFSENF